MSGLDPKDLDQYDAEPEATSKSADEQLAEQLDSGIDVRIPTPAPEDDDTTLDDLLNGGPGGCARTEGAS